MANLPTCLALFGVSGGEIIAVLALALLLFGGAKLPQLARGLGQSIKEFKKAAKDDSDDDKAEKKPETPGKPGNN